MNSFQLTAVPESISLATSNTRGRFHNSHVVIGKKLMPIAKTLSLTQKLSPYLESFLDIRLQLQEKQLMIMSERIHFTCHIHSWVLIQLRLLGRLEWKGIVRHRWVFSTSKGRSTCKWAARRGSNRPAHSVWPFTLEWFYVIFYVIYQAKQGSSNWVSSLIFFI